jgi:hypothetical protein
MNKRLFTFGAYLLGSVILTQTPVRSQSLDIHLSEAIAGVKDKDFKTAIEGTSKAVGRLRELYRVAEDYAQPVQTLADELEKGLDVFTGAPRELEQLNNLIRNDTAIIEARTISSPTLSDPMQGVSRADLYGSDSAKHREALGRLRSQTRELRREHGQQLARLQRERTEAVRLRDESRETLDRGLQMERVLEEVNSSAASPLLNAYGGRIGFMLLDVTEHINPSLTERWQAATNLVRKYDLVIGEVEDAGKPIKALEDWTGFYQWQEAVRTQAPFTKEMDEANRLQEEIQSTGRRSVPGASAQAQFINKLAERMHQETGIAITRAKDLIEQARRRDAAAARQAEMDALVNLAATIGGAAASGPRSTAAPSPPARNNILIESSPPYTPSEPAPTLRPRL